MHKISTRMVYVNGKFHLLGSVQRIFSTNLIF